MMQFVNVSILMKPFILLNLLLTITLPHSLLYFGHLKAFNAFDRWRWLIQ